MKTTYITRLKDDSLLAEGHIKHIDIQYITKGEEVIEVYSKDECELVQAYDKETDVAFYRPIKPGRKIVLKPYEFAILYPEDLHITALVVNQQVEVEKIVIKIPYNK
jgi:YhcH/YjgK/YiaL family protein